MAEGPLCLTLTGSNSSLLCVEFNILPHPATTNNPSDLQSDPNEQGGLQSSAANAYNARGPHVPDQATAQGLEQPKSREEVCACVEPLFGVPQRPHPTDVSQLKAEAAKLNQ